MKLQLPLLFSILIIGAFVSEAISQNLLASPHFLEARKKAEEEQKKLLVHFTASWSNPCSRMFSTTYRDEEIRGLIRNDFIFTLIDIDDFDGYVLSQHYNINNLPTLVLFDHNGRILKKHQGKLSAEELKNFLGTEADPDSDLMAEKSLDNKPGMMERINNNPGKEKEVIAEVNETKKHQAETAHSNNRVEIAYYAIQLGAFSDKANAENMLNNYSSYSIQDLHVQSELMNERERFILLGGKFNSREQAEQKLAELRSNGKDGFIKFFNNSNS